MPHPRHRVPSTATSTGTLITAALSTAVLAVGALTLAPQSAARADAGSNPSAGPTVSATASPTVSITPTPAPTTTPTPATTAVLTGPTHVRVPGSASISWPKHGRAQLAVAGIGVMGRSGDAKSVPIASVTKVMTAYLVLRDHPLTAGQNGPKIKVTHAEASSYARRQAAGESLVKVASGELISERQALQGLLLASGNNMADILARWDAGSRSAFIDRMNQTAAELGLTSTHFADPSGLNAASRSTTADLLVLAPAAMADPTFATLVRTRSASIPLNKIKNTNRLLGRHGVIGIKTGSTSAAGGCLLFAAQKTVAGRVYTIYGARLGAPGPKILTNALANSDALVVAAGKALRVTTLVPAGRAVATLTSADGTLVKLAATQDLTAVGWPGLTYTLALPVGLQPGQIPTVLTARSGAQTVSVPLARVS